MNKLALLTILSMGAAMYGHPNIMGMDDDYIPQKRNKRISSNEKRKCLRNGCNNLRINETDLYCCDECKNTARENESAYQNFKKLQNENS